MGDNLPKRKKVIKVELRPPLITDFWNETGNITCPCEDMLARDGVTHDRTQLIIFIFIHNGLFHTHGRDNQLSGFYNSLR